MTGTKKYLVAMLLLAVLTGASAQAAEITVSAQVDTSESIYTGQTFTYFIVITGTTRPGQVNISPLAFFKPQYAGGSPRSETSISIVNGRQIRKVLERYIMSYQLSAPKPGKITIPSINVTVVGKTYKTNPITIAIVEPETTPQLVMEMNISKQTCYVGEPVVLEIKWFVRENIAGLVKDFKFNIPALVSDAFIIDDPGQHSPKASPYNIDGTTVYTENKKVVRDGVNWVEVSFKKILMPKQLGSVKIDTASVLSKIAVGRKRVSAFNTQYEFKRFISEAAPVDLEVLPLPKQAKPKGFYGLIGEYKISTSAAPAKVNIGEPITLTITIEGDYLKPVRWPDLENIADFASNFKIPAERSSPAIQNGRKIFTQTIRANSDSVKEIPPVALPCFDTEKGSYLTVYSDPIPLDVAATSILTSADIQGRAASNVNRKVEATRKGINANYETIDLFTEQSFSIAAAIAQPAMLTVVTVPFAAFLLSLIVKLATFKSPGAVEAKVRRLAARNAIGDIKKLPKDSSDKYKLAISIMQRYVGQRFGRVANSITAGDCRDVILTATDSITVADSFKEIFESCENACYTGTNVDFDPAKLTALIRDIEKGAGK